MKVLLKDIQPDGLKVERDLTRDFIGGLLEGVVDVRLDQAQGRVRAELTRNGARVFVRAQVQARFHVPCARCLEAAEVRADGPFVVTYVPAQLEPLAAGHELEPDDLEILTYRGDEIDLTQLVRDQLLLAIPLVALCRSDCRGLCQVCGAELNAGPCGCKSPPMEASGDGPFARLGALRRPGPS